MEVSQKLICMSKVRKVAEITANIPFTEFDFYDLYRSTFEKSELGRIKKLLPLHEMAENFGLVSKSMKPKLGRKSYFTAEGKVALMFLKMYTGLSCPKLTEILYIFFGIHTANVVQLADRIEQRAQLAASWNENMHMEKCFQGGTAPLS